MSDHDFQIEMLNQLRELAVGQAAIGDDMSAVKEHLKTFNGKVASHEKELNERRNQCLLADALEDRIRPVEDFVVASRASEKTSASWLRWLWPIIWAAAGAFVLLLALHAKSMLRIHL
jgi:hypothetical protein